MKSTRRCSPAPAEAPRLAALLLVLAAPFAPGLHAAWAQEAAPATAPASAALPHGLDSVQSLDESRRRLVELRDAGKITQSEMREYARRLEPRLRGNELGRLGFGSSVARTGSAPSKGNGTLTDEDGTARSEQEYRRLREYFRERARTRPTTVREVDRFSFKVDELDTIVWKHDVPRAVRPESIAEQAMAAALNPEYAPSAAPGSANRFGLEAMLENYTKGADALSRPIPAEPHLAEDAIIKAAKDVERALDASGLRDRHRDTYYRLAELRTRAKSPAELGIKDLGAFQEQLRTLMGECFEVSQQKLRREVAGLQRQLQTASGAERARLLQTAQQLQERAIRIGARFEVLANQHPEMMRRISGGHTIRTFMREQMDAVRGLERAKQPPAAGHARSLTVLLNMALVVQCMQEMPPAPSGQEQRAQFADCIKVVAQRQIPAQVGMFVMLQVVSPTGAVLIVGGMTVVAGAYSAVQIYEAGYEAWRVWQAWNEEQAARDRLAAGQQSRVGTMAAQFAAEEQRVAGGVEALERRRAQLLEDLAAASALERIGSGRLEAGLKRLVVLLRDVRALETDCERLAASPGPAADRVAAAEGRAARIEHLLTRARADATSCGQANLARADALHAEAERLGEELRRVTAGAADAASPETKLAALREARETWTALRDEAADADWPMRLLEELRDTAPGANAELEAEKTSLLGGIDRLQVAFPPEAVGHEGVTQRLDAMRARVRAVLPISDAELRPFSQEHTRLLTLVEDVERGRRQDVEATLQQGERCAAQLADRSADDGSQRLDTARTLGELALVKLGAGYREARGACEQRLARSGGGTVQGAAPPAAPAGDVPSTARGAKPAEPPFDRAALEKALAWEEERLGCLEQGKAATTLEVDCNGTFMVGSRDNHIANHRRRIAEMRTRLGLPPLPDAPPASPSAQGRGTARPGATGAGVTRVSAVTGSALHEPAAGGRGALAAGQAVQPGARVQSGASGQVTLETGTGARVLLGPNTIVRMPDPPGGRILLERGRVHVRRDRAGERPDFSGIEIAAPPATVDEVGTEYTVEIKGTAATVEVMSGEVRVAGPAIYRIARWTPDRDGPKPAPAEQVSLTAGDRAEILAIGRSSSTAAARGGQVAAPEPVRPPAGPSSAVGAPPAILTGGAAPRPVAPWDDPAIQQAIDRWLAEAVARVLGEGREVRYNPWAQPLATGAVSTGRPDHPADWSRYRYVWERRERLTSVNLGTLAEYLDGRRPSDTRAAASAPVPSWIAGSAPAAPPRVPPPPAAPSAAPIAGSADAQQRVDRALERARSEAGDTDRVYEERRREEARRAEQQRREEAERRAAAERRRIETERQAAAEQARLAAEREREAQASRERRQQRARAAQQTLQRVLAGVIDAGQDATGGSGTGAAAGATPPHAAGNDDVPAVGFEGRWYCAVTPDSSDGAAAREVLHVRRVGDRYEATAEGSAGRLVSTSVQGTRIRFEGEAGVETSVWGGRYDLVLSGNTLSGRGVEYIVTGRDCQSCADAPRETVNADVSCGRRPRW